MLVVWYGDSVMGFCDECQRSLFDSIKVGTFVKIRRLIIMSFTRMESLKPSVATLPQRPHTGIMEGCGDTYS